jgi:hypothetical protein
MIYTFPKHCACFPMLDGNVCLAPPGKDKPQDSTELVKGPAWPAAPQEADYSAEWPMFRHDAYHSGGTDVTVPVELQVLWSAAVEGPDYTRALTAEWSDNPYAAGRVTAPTIAGGLVFVAHTDTHRLLAIDARTGQERWHFIAGGRIDGPPTVHKGMCLVGCRDGWVYNLRAADGALVWKLRVAPNERRIVGHGQLESPWPVPGSVLVTDGLAYVAAGLHPNADGGVRVVCFRPETGEVVWQGKFDNLGFADPWPDPWEPRKTRPDSDPWPPCPCPCRIILDLPRSRNPTSTVPRLQVIRDPYHSSSAGTPFLTGSQFAGSTVMSFTPAASTSVGGPERNPRAARKMSV